MSTVALRSSSGWSYPVLSAGALAGALVVHPPPNRGNSTLALRQRYQISERDIPQRLAVYHGTRGVGPTQGGGNFASPCHAGLIGRDRQLRSQVTLFRRLRVIRTETDATSLVHEDS